MTSIFEIEESLKDYLQKNITICIDNKILKSISEKPLSSLVEIKRLINKDASLKDERQTFYKLLDSENKKIGIKSFFEKIKPEWK